MKKMDRRMFLAGAVAAPLAYGLHEVLSASEPEELAKPVVPPQPLRSDAGSLNPKAPPPALPPQALDPNFRDPCPACGMACVDERSREFLRLQGPVQRQK